MHEVAICQSIIQSLETELEESQYENLREVHVKAGVLSCVEPSILQHVFKFMIVDTPLQHCTLKVERVEVLAECGYCETRFNVEQYRFICPQCGKPVEKIIEGNELQIYKIILEQPAHEEVDQ
jgi:hydrogenase nickel incorporation protein HypA/HybF